MTPPGPVIYMNHATTWPLDPRVREAMLPALEEDPRLEGSLLSDGRKMARTIDQARDFVAALAGSPPDEIVFTSGGTEACNLAIKGACMARLAQGRHGRLLVCATDRDAVLHPARSMAKLGFEVLTVPVDRQGVIDLDRLEALLPGAFLVCMPAADEETGTLQPLAEAAALVSREGALLHVDGCLAAGYMPVNCGAMGADLLSLSAHRIGGPRGAGALRVRRGVRLVPLVEGGSQEGGLRAGMPDVAAVCGFGEAARLTALELPDRSLRLDRLGRGLAGLLLALEGTRLNGHPGTRLHALVNVSAAGVNGEAILLKMARRGVAASSGSSCVQEAGKPSRVLMAMGVEEAMAQSSVLFALGPSTSSGDVALAAGAMAAALAELRAVAPSRRAGPQRRP